MTKKMKTDDDILDRVDTSECKDVKLPPMPLPFRPPTEADIKYTGDLKDYKQRCLFKMYAFWQLWAELRTNEKIESLVSRVPEDKDSDEAVSKHCIVDIINQLAIVLSATNIMDEIAWLTLNEEEFQERQKNLAKMILETLNERKNNQESNKE